MMQRKGFYFKKGKDNSIYLNIYKADFIQYINSLPNVNEWVKFRIYERSEQDSKGHTHNMEAVKISEDQNNSAFD